MDGVVQHGRVVMGVTMQIVMVHRPLKVITVQAGHGSRGRMLMMLNRQGGRGSRHEILKTQIRVAAAASGPGEFEATPAPAAPLHAIEGRVD